MELIVFIFELLIGLIDVLTVGADIHAWFKGRENRLERRAAKQAGLPPPPRDRWNRRVIVLTILAVLFTSVTVFLWLRR